MNSAGISSCNVFDKGIAQKVAVLPGYLFYIDGEGDDTIRMNFSAAPEDQIIDGIHRLVKVISSLR